MTLIKNIALSLCIIGITLGGAQAELPQISKARIIQPPPGAKVAAAYFVINNPSDDVLIINSASSDAIPKVSIHLSKVVDDVAKMLEQKSVSVEPGSSLEFKHGSYHLMLMGLTSALEPGTSLSFTLNTNMGILPLEIPILTPDEASNGHGHSMKDSSMKMDHGTKKMDHGTMKMDHGSMDMDKN